MKQAWRDKKHIKFELENFKERDHLGNLSTDG
jgi:hypothetical protein